MSLWKLMYTYLCVNGFLRFICRACNPTPPNNIGLWYKKFCLHEVQGLDQEMF